MNACYFKTNHGNLYRLCQKSKTCDQCHQKTLTDACRRCNGITNDIVLREALSIFDHELIFKRGDHVDVFIKEIFGWIEGEIVACLYDQFCYLVRLESVHKGGDCMVQISFWPTIHDEYGLAVHRTYCLADWRMNKEYTHIECFIDDKWISCRRVHQNKDTMLVVWNDCESDWFATDSPLLRMSWDFD